MSAKASTPTRLQQPHGHAAKAKAYNSQSQGSRMGTLPRPRHACYRGQGSPLGKQIRPKQPPLAGYQGIYTTKPHGHAAMAKPCNNQGKGLSPRHAYCQGQGSLMVTKPRPRQVAVKAKPRSHGNVAKAKSCILPRLRQPHGHATKAKVALRPCYQCMHATKANAAPWSCCHSIHIAKVKAAPWTCSQGQGMQPRPS